MADQDLLLCVLAIARSELYREAIDQDDKILEALEIDLKGGSINEKETFRLLELPALKISLTRYELLKELQRSTSGAKNYKWLEASLDRLGAVSFKYDGARWSGSFNLLSYRFNKDTEQYDIFINPISAHSVWSQKANYIFIHRQERHLLKADASRVLHSYLSGVVRLGETRHIGIDTVVSAVWAQYDEEVSSDTFRFRAKQISDGCKELSRLNGWSAEIVGRGKKAKVKVSRSK
ncbi:hypothetical protein HKB35_25160 [Vibrio alginolyticus]|uniref:Uncharacterized protein n=1 Tax=Vibrio alginolyticus TaxID=663 RepID=A0A7Y0N0N4_VIBAL|nr:hypothetical protein [Vibrio alginolyticus]